MKGFPVRRERSRRRRVPGLGKLCSLTTRFSVSGGAGRKNLLTESVAFDSISPYLAFSLNAGRKLSWGAGMKRAFRFAVAALSVLMATSAMADEDRETLNRQESMAGVCAFAPMPPKERLDACKMLLGQRNLPAKARAVAHLGLSQAYRQTGDFQAALSNIDHAIRLAPDYAPAFVTRGAMRLSRDRIAPAIADASKAIELDRRNPAGYLLRAEAYLRQSRPAFALGDMDEAIAIAPNEPRARLIRAYANMALERPKRALVDARAALKLSPEMVSAYLVRAQIYLSTGQFARAGADAGRATDLAPKDRLAQDAATVAFTELARFDRAKAAADALVRLAPRDPDALNARCWVLALLPDPAAALADCDAAVAADPSHVQARDSRAFAYWQLGRKDEARADLERAAELEPDLWDWSKREGRFAIVMARRYLKAMGRYGGPLDGDFDDEQATAAAIRAYQVEIGLDATGEPSADLIARLARDSAKID